MTKPWLGLELIASTYGYDKSPFSRSFRAQFGVSPREYRSAFRPKSERKR